jgi:hypothetical protein
MSDTKRGLPVRTQEDPDLKLQVKIVDEANPDTQQMTVDTDKNAHVEVHGNRVDDAADIVLALSEEGHANTRGDYDVDDNSKPSSSAPIMHQRKNTAETPALADQLLRPTGIAYDNGVDETIVAQDVAIRDHNGVPWSKDNPMPISLEESAGEEIHDYLEHVDVTQNGGTNNHEFVVALGETLLLEQVLCDASVAHKMDLYIGDGAASEAFVKKATRFASEVHDTADVELKRSIKIIGTADGTTVRITVTNRDKHDDSSIYTTIVGLKY